MPRWNLQHTEPRCSQALPDTSRWRELTGGQVWTRCGNRPNYWPGGRDGNVNPYIDGLQIVSGDSDWVGNNPPLICGHCFSTWMMKEQLLWANRALLRWVWSVFFHEVKLGCVAIFSVSWARSPPLCKWTIELYLPWSTWEMPCMLHKHSSALWRVLGWEAVKVRCAISEWLLICSSDLCHDYATKKNYWCAWKITYGGKKMSVVSHARSCLQMTSAAGPWLHMWTFRGGVWVSMMTGNDICAGG